MNHLHQFCELTNYFKSSDSKEQFSNESDISTLLVNNLSRG